MDQGSSTWLGQYGTRREQSPGLKAAIPAATGPLFLCLTPFSGPRYTDIDREVDSDWDGNAKERRKRLRRDAPSDSRGSGSPRDARRTPAESLAAGKSRSWDPGTSLTTPLNLRTRRQRAQNHATGGPGKPGRLKRRGGKGRGGDWCLQAPGAPWPALGSIRPVLAVSGTWRATE